MKYFEHKIIVLVLLAFVVQGCVSFSDIVPEDTIKEDLKTVVICEQGLSSLLDFCNEQVEPWGLSEGVQDVTLNRYQKVVLLDTWSSLLDYLAQLDHVQQQYSDVFIKNEKDSDREALYCYYFAFLTQYRYALEFLDLIENNENIHIYLNEASPQFGLEEDLYKKFKYHFLNVFLATKFVALDAILSETKPPSSFHYLSLMEETEVYLYEMGTGNGTRLTFENGLKIMEDAAFGFWLPLQKGVSKFLGGKKVWRVDQMLLSSKEVKSIGERLEPGDILFTRKEWALTNLGLPGFWTHVALYIGSPEERTEYFSDEETRKWMLDQGLKTDGIEAFLQLTYDESYQEGTTPTSEGKPLRVIEALSPGVIFNSLETTLSCDGVAVLRPRVSKLEKARAISFAFASLGKPYDLNFDFQTDSALVCSELVLKSFEPLEGQTGLAFETTQIGQRSVTPCNSIMQQFSEQYGTPEQQLDFILFYDGYERQGKAIESDLEELLESWKRPDWHIFLQK
mgnify:CR=1 FL=1